MHSRLQNLCDEWVSPAVLRLLHYVKTQVVSTVEYLPLSSFFSGTLSRRVVISSYIKYTSPTFLGLSAGLGLLFSTNAGEPPVLLRRPPRGVSFPLDTAGEREDRRLDVGVFWAEFVDWKDNRPDLANSEGSNNGDTTQDAKQCRPPIAIEFPVLNS